MVWVSAPMNALIAKQKFVVVEDNPAMLTLLRLLVTALGAHRVFSTDKGETAKAAIVAERPDIVITDLKMAPVDGVALTEWIRRGPDSPNQEIGVIMTSAYSEPHRIVAARDAGVDEFMAKPFTVNRLFRCIVAVAANRRPFIRAETYVGPCRRRGKIEGYAGPFRRADDATPDADDADVAELAV